MWHFPREVQGGSRRFLAAHQELRSSPAAPSAPPVENQDCAFPKSYIFIQPVCEPSQALVPRAATRRRSSPSAITDGLWSKSTGKMLKVAEQNVLGFAHSAQVGDAPPFWLQSQSWPNSSTTITSRRPGSQEATSTASTIAAPACGDACHTAASQAKASFDWV